MRTLKIAITGNYAVGKTEFVRSVSDTTPLNTDYGVSLDAERTLKTYTTVALDFGILTVDDQLQVYVYGTPGSDRFDFMRDYLISICVGFVILVDSCRPVNFAETQRLIKQIRQWSSVPFVVAANKQDNPAALPLDYIRQRLRLPMTIPLLPCVATDHDSVKMVLLSLLRHIATHSDEVAMG